MSDKPHSFYCLNIAVLTVSDSRDQSYDTSGDYLAAEIDESGHQLAERSIVADNRYAIREVVSRWIASQDVQVIIVNGGTGFYPKNSTSEALLPLLDQKIDGLGELFRMLSYENIGPATVQSRALAGLANKTLIFAVPGSGSACQIAWQQIIVGQLDRRTCPCNFVS